jgi:hypothetical protein
VGGGYLRMEVFVGGRRRCVDAFRAPHLLSALGWWGNAILEEISNQLISKTHGLFMLENTWAW